MIREDPFNPNGGRFSSFARKRKIDNYYYRLENGFLEASTKRLGIRQRKTIDTMIRYGDGRWKPEWHTDGAQNELLRNLARRKVIEPIGKPQDNDYHRQEYKLKGWDNA